MDLVIRTLDGPAPGAQPVEIVERKGVGHPDTICDALAEAICVRLCREYEARFGTILHHNVDKILLCGGSAHAVFGGGAVLAPIELYLAGRATDELRGVHIPTSELAEDACRVWLRENLPDLDVERHVKIFPRLRPGSRDLARLFGRGSAGAPLANDTSCGAGFAPRTDLERVVLEVERALNSDEIRRKHPAFGRDIKVMGVRREDRIALTIGCAMIGRHVADPDAYEAAKRQATEVALAAARRTTRLGVEAVVNAGDQGGDGEVFLTVTGLSAEAGDDGEVGRGNRASGLITPYRPMTLEAAAGKNPVTHVGKLYNVAASAIAERLVDEVAAITHANCVLVSRIGRPIDDPQIADVQLALVPGSTSSDVAQAAEAIVRGELNRFPALRTHLLEGRVRVY
jgi:S-adenosylmethionine synthetase